MRSALSLILSFTLTGAMLIGSTGCSKEKEQIGDQQKAASSEAGGLQEDPILKTELLKKIPATSVGFLVMDLKGEPFKKFKASPWGSDVGGLSTVQTILDEMKKNGTDEAQVAIIESVLASLKKIGLISADGKSQIDQMVSDVVWFIDAPAVGNESAVNVGMFASAAGTTNLKEKLSLVESMIKEAGLVPSKETYVGAEGFSIAPPETAGADAAKQVGSIYFAASEKKVGFARNKASLELIFKDDAQDGISAVKASPEFKKALASISSAGPSMSLAYLSLQRLLPTIDKISKESATAESPSEFDAKTFPLDGIILSQGIDKQLTTTVALVLTGRTDNQKTVLTALEGSALPAMAAKLPKDVALALSLDTKFLTKLEPLLQGMQNEASAEGFKVVKNIQGATFGIRNNDAGSPFPDLFFAIEATNRDELGKLLETALGQALSSSGAPVTPWQSKDIDGAPTRYFSTPLGIGLFVASPKGSTSLLVASSERAIKDSLAAASGASQSLSSTLSAGLQEKMSSSKLGVLYLNFVQIGNVVDSVKSSLAMFTGGASEIDKQLDSNRIRQWGSNVTGVAFKDGVLKIESSLEKTVAPATN